MPPSDRRLSGFTLLEIIIVLAVISALVAILTPRVVVYIDDANQSRARADANGLAAAIDKMYRDTGRWPFYEDGTGSRKYTAGTDYALLTSHTACTGAGPASVCDATAPEDDTTLDTWDLTTALTDSLVHHLIMNTPAYATSGGRAWKGPYVDQVPEVDPWGRSYLVNIANAAPQDEGPTQRWVIVISAGPDGALDTSADLQGTSNPVAGGDDIIARVK
jgi:prepilin-type N-terminal cleavage/methylation domain-containing protein